MRMQDPTREEMLKFLTGSLLRSEASEFDVEEAIWWFASDFHGGQSSNLYAALCASPFKPGPIATLDPFSIAAWLYDDLRHEYANFDPLAAQWYADSISE
jgi:hypothetical protein